MVNSPRCRLWFLEVAAGDLAWRKRAAGNGKVLRSGEFPAQRSLNMLPGVVMDQLDGVLPYLARVTSEHSFPGKFTGTLMVRHLFRRNFAGFQVDGETQLEGRNGKGGLATGQSAYLKLQVPGRNPLKTG